MAVGGARETEGSIPRGGALHKRTHLWILPLAIPLAVSALILTWQGRGDGTIRRSPPTRFVVPEDRPGGPGGRGAASAGAEDAPAARPLPDGLDLIAFHLRMGDTSRVKALIAQVAEGGEGRIPRVSARLAAKGPPDYHLALAEILSKVGTPGAVRELVTAAEWTEARNAPEDAFRLENLLAAIGCVRNPASHALLAELAWTHPSAAVRSFALDAAVETCGRRESLALLDQLLSDPSRGDLWERATDHHERLLLGEEGR